MCVRVRVQAYGTMGVVLAPFHLLREQQAIAYFQAAVAEIEHGREFQNHDHFITLHAQHDSDPETLLPQHLISDCDYKSPQLPPNTPWPTFAFEMVPDHPSSFLPDVNGDQQGAISLTLLPRFLPLPESSLGIAQAEVLVEEAEHVSVLQFQPREAVHEGRLCTKGGSAPREVVHQCFLVYLL